jgi:hypothetical protein
MREDYGRSRTVIARSRHAQNKHNAANLIGLAENAEVSQGRRFKVDSTESIPLSR